MGVAGGGFKNIQVLLSANNSSLKSVFIDSGRQVEAFEKKVQGVDKTTSKLGTGLKAGLAAGALAVGAGLAFAITKASAFDAAMRNVNSLTRLNEAQFAAMEKQVISMSKELPQSATVLAEGLYDIASSGFQGADGLKVLDAAARSASAGLTTTSVSSKAITAVLNAYGLQAKDAADVSDVLFSTVNMGVISFEELAGNLGDVVGATAAAKVGIDQVGSAIATMTLSGIKGAQATTALSSLTTKLVQPSAALAKLYKQLGYESGAAALEQKGLRGVMEDVRKATGGNITALLQLFPDIEAARGALALMANEGANYAKVAGEIEDKTKRAGATQEVLDEQMKAVANQAKLLTNNVEAAAISLGVKLIPSLLKVMEGGRDAAGGLRDLVGELQERMGPGFEDVADAGENLWEVLESIGKVVVAVGKPLAGLAVDGVVDTFNALASVLALTTGLIDDHKGVVIALGIAYGIHLAGGVAKASTAIGVQMVLGLANALGSIDVLTAKAKTAGSALKTMAMNMAPGLAVGAAIAVAVTAWASYSAGAEEARRTTEKVERAMNSFNVDELARSIKEADAFIADTQKRLAEFGNDDNKIDMSTLFDFQDNYKLLAATKNLDDVEASANAAKQQLANMQYNTTELFRIMGKPLPDEAKWINDVQGANGVQAQNEAMKQMQGLLDTLGPKLKAAGVNMGEAWDVQQMTNAYSALQGIRDGSDQAASAQAALIEAMGGVSSSMGDASDAADKLKTALDGLMGASLGIDQAQIDWMENLNKLKVTLKENGATLSFNTAKGRENRQAVIDQVGSLQDVLVAAANAGEGQKQLTGRLAAGRNALIAAGTSAGFTKGEMAALLAQYKLTPELVQTLITESGAASTAEKLKDVKAKADALAKTKPKPTVSAETTVAQSRLNSVQNRLDQIDGRNASASVTVTTTQNTYRNMIETHTTRPDVGVRVNANGSFKSPVKSFAGGKMPLDALIQPASGPGGLVQWAEDSTEGEAFIPLARSKRGRSTRILEAVAEQFGLRVVEAFAGGGFRFPGFRFNPKAGGTRSSQYSEWKDRYYSAYEEWKDRQRLYATAAGRNAEGRADYSSGTTAGTVAEVSSAAERRAQALAEYQAKVSKNPSDSAEDFYKKPVVALRTYQQTLKQTETYQRQWGATMTKVASYVGTDVVKSLEGMGEEGEALLRAMAKGTVAQMRQMADQLRRIDYANFVTTTAQDVKGRTEFQGNLAALVKMGRADLAAKFSEMGYENAAGLAAQAVKTPASGLAALNALLGQQEALSGEGGKSAFRLAGLLQGSATPLGVLGLARASGMPVGDVLGLLSTYQASVFSKMPASKYKQVAADLALLKAGKQPSGLQDGGIVAGSRTGDAMYYRWAEPGSGGESLIPHGANKRGRALALWEQTGRIIGARAGGGSNVTIAPGAVSLTVNAPRAGASAEEIRRVAQGVVSDGMNQMVRIMNQGRR